jgi:hypothetical protein
LEDGNLMSGKSYGLLLVVIGLLGLGACGSLSSPEGGEPLATASRPVTQTPIHTPSPSPSIPATDEAELGPPPETDGQGNADVLHVRAVQTGGDTWTFHVTVQHPDTGWEDYADGWDVVAPDGTVLKPDPDGPFTRLLLHPHVDEQPFTRSQSGIVIPPGVVQVRVRAHDLVDGYGGREVLVDLTTPTGQGFEVER